MKNELTPKQLENAIKKGEQAIEIIKNDPTISEEYKLTNVDGKAIKSNGYEVSELDLNSPIFNNILLKVSTVLVSKFINRSMQKTLFNLVEEIDAINLVHTREYVGTKSPENYDPTFKEADFNPSAAVVYESTYQIDKKIRAGINIAPSKMIGSAPTVAKIGELVSEYTNVIYNALFERVSNETGALLVGPLAQHNILVDSTLGVDGVTPATAEDYFQAIVAFESMMNSHLVRKIPGITDGTLKENEVQTTAIIDVPLNSEMTTKVLPKYYHDKEIKSKVDFKNTFLFKAVVPGTLINMVVVGNNRYNKYSLLAGLRQTSKFEIPSTLMENIWAHLWYALIADPYVPSVAFGPGLNKTTAGYSTLTAPDKMGNSQIVGEPIEVTLKEFVEGTWY